MTSKEGAGGESVGGGRSSWHYSDFPTVILLVALAAVPVGIVLIRFAEGANAKGQASLAIVPWALAVFIDARASRSPWSHTQRLLLRFVLGLAIIAISLCVLTQPREEFEENNACGPPQLGLDLEPCQDRGQLNTPSVHL